MNESIYENLNFYPESFLAMEKVHTDEIIFFKLRIIKNSDIRVDLFIFSYIRNYRDFVKLVFANVILSKFVID